MTGKEAILDYLKTHGEFRIPQIASTYGISVATVANYAKTMVEGGEIYISSRKWCDVRYRLRTDLNEQSVKVDIFKQCKESPAMKRMLAFYGRTQA